MEYLDQLSTDNSEKISNLFGIDYAQSSAQDILKTNDVIEANEKLADALYGVDISNMVRANKIHSLQGIASEILEYVSAPETLINDLDINRVGLVVIRPEAMDLADTSREFLLNKELRVLLDKTTRINFHQYLSLYTPGLLDPDAKYDFPTRTLNYIDKDIRVFAVTDEGDRQYTQSTSTYITECLKGSQGSFKANTLRGHIAYNALRSLVGVDGESFITPRLNIALDPIGAYRQLVSGGIPSDRAHASADSSLLFYAGQSMHVPNNGEISRDVRILLTEDEIATITESLKS